MQTKLSTRMLALLAMFIALQIVLSKFLMLQLTPSLRLSVDSVPILLAGLWFGPLAGGAVGALSDLLGTALFPTAGAYYPPLTVAFILIGVIAGLFRRSVQKQFSFLSVALAVFACEVAGSLLWKSLALSWLVGAPFPVLLLGRALPVLGVAAVDAVLVFAICRLAGTYAANSASKVTTHGSSAVASAASMTYDEALSYIHSVTWRGSRLGLERTNELLDRVGRPDRKLKFIHIAGTNGKGSTAAMLSSILTHAGYRVGLYTSPFINRFNERIATNGVPIPDDALAALTAAVKPEADAMADHPTEFELITVIGFLYFVQEACDIVVLEVGLGGEFDSTNVIDVPELAVITNIGLDHTRELGPTIPDVAKAKAGIIKEGGDVVIYGENAEADAVFENACAERHAHLTKTDHSLLSNVHASLDRLTFDFGQEKGLACALVGSYQVHNAAVVLTAVDALREKGWRIPGEAVRAGLSQVKWPARFEILCREPLFIADGGHNPQGVAAAVDSIELHLPGKKLVFLLGVMADKDVAHMLERIVPIAERAVAVTPDNPRAMPATELSERLSALGIPSEPAKSVSAGVQRAMELAGTGGAVCALGSLYMLGDVRKALHAE